MRVKQQSSQSKIKLANLFLDNLFIPSKKVPEKMGRYCIVELSAKQKPKIITAV